MSGSSKLSSSRNSTSGSLDDSRKHSTSDEVSNVQQSNQQPPDEFPEGGLRAWLTVLGAFLIQFCGFGYTSSFGVYQDYYTRIYITNASSSAISWIGSVNGCIVIASGLLAGRLYDRGYFFHLLYGGSLLIAVSLFMLSLCKPNHFYQNFLAQALGHGFGAGMMYIPSVAVVSHYFKARRSVAMSIVASGSALGAFTHPIMLNNLLNGPLGFAGATRASAGLITGMLLIACVITRPRLPPPLTSPNFINSAKKFFRDKMIVITAIGLMSFSIGFYFPMFYLQLDAVEHGLNKTFAFYSLVIMNVSSFFGRLSPVIFAKPLGIPNMILISTVCCSVLIFGMLGVKSVAGVVVFAIIYGFFVGIFMTVIAPLVAILTEDMSELGVRMGFAFALCGIGALVGPPIEGALLSSKFIWWRPIVFSGIFAAAGAACFLTMILMLIKKKRAIAAIKAASMNSEKTV